MKNIPLVLFFILLLSGCQKQNKKEPIKKTKKVTPQAPAGLKTKVLRKAINDTKKATTGNTVTVNYTGWIANEDEAPDRQIDSSIERHKPLEFTIGLQQVIKGFEEGVMLMSVGEKRRLIIAPELGYGERGIGLFIPPNSTLIFDIELLKIS